MKNIAMLITDELDLYVPWFLDKLLNVDIRISEGGFGFCTGGIEGIIKLRLLPHDAHASSAATRSSFYNNR